MSWIGPPKTYAKPTATDLHEVDQKAWVQDPGGVEAGMSPFNILMVTSDEGTILMVTSDCSNGY